jgi:hypothetical protein
MEIRARELTLAEAAGLAPPNSQPSTEFPKLLVETIFALRLSLDDGR